MTLCAENCHRAQEQDNKGKHPRPTYENKTKQNKTKQKTCSLQHNKSDSSSGIHLIHFYFFMISKLQIYNVCHSEITNDIVTKFRKPFVSLQIRSDAQGNTFFTSHKQEQDKTVLQK